MPTGAGPFGPHNPHPLSARRVELVWEGKYDECGRKRVIDPAGLAAPLIRRETCEGTGSPDGFRNRLILGDNKLALAGLLPEFAGRVDLVYIDPPFAVGADFPLTVPLGGGKRDALAMTAYRDVWDRGLDGYLAMLHERLTLIRLLLAETGNLLVHIDYRVNSLVRLLLDEIFGPASFLNEIIWYYNSGAREENALGRRHHTILRYGRDAARALLNADSPYSRVPYSPDINIPASKAHYYDSRGKVRDDVLAVPLIAQNDKRERLGYGTQKPERLLEILIGCFSREGDLVADFFCGSGTTGAVAERLNRRWIMCDLGCPAVHTARKRLLELGRKLHQEGKPSRSFDLCDLGGHERKRWLQERLTAGDEDYRRAILESYGAETLAAARAGPLHGRKGQALVHVAEAEGAFTEADLRAAVQETAAAGARELHCLAWEFAPDLRRIGDEIGAAAGVRMRLRRIPREIMETNRTASPPFLEPAVLRAEPVFGVLPDGQRGVEIRLVEFSPAMPEAVDGKHEALPDRADPDGFVYLDFWVVDFDFRPDKPFACHWYACRTRRKRDLPLVSDCRYAGYDRPGKYLACVKAIDVFGMETAITLEIDIPAGKSRLGMESNLSKEQLPVTEGTR